MMVRGKSFVLHSNWCSLKGSQESDYMVKAIPFESLQVLKVGHTLSRSELFLRFSKEFVLQTARIHFGVPWKCVVTGTWEEPFAKPGLCM